MEVTFCGVTGVYNVALCDANFKRISGTEKTGPVDSEPPQPKWKIDKYKTPIGKSKTEVSVTIEQSVRNLYLQNLVPAGDQVPLIPCSVLSSQRRISGIKDPKHVCHVPITCDGPKQSLPCMIAREHTDKVVLKFCGQAFGAEDSPIQPCEDNVLQVGQGRATSTDVGTNQQDVVNPDCDGDVIMTEAPGNPSPGGSLGHLLSYPEGCESQGSQGSQGFLEIFFTMALLEGRIASQDEPEFRFCEDLPTGKAEQYGPEAGCQVEMSCLAALGGKRELAYRKCRLNQAGAYQEVDQCQTMEHNLHWCKLYDGEFQSMGF